MTEENTIPVDLNHFNALNYNVYVNNTVGKLTNYRPLGNRYDKKAAQIMNGYHKILSFMAKLEK